MKQSRFTDSQIIEAIKLVEAGLAVSEPCRDLCEYGQVLQVALEVQRYGCVADGPHDEAGSRKRSAAQVVRQGEAQGKDCDGGARKKWWDRLAAAR